jgi:predicted N-acetyltransferase YhbS
MRNKSKVIIRPEKPAEYKEVNKLIFEAFSELHNIKIGRFMMEHFEERKKETFIPELSIVAVLENGIILEK